jgi:hypothetical protein
MKYHFGAYLEIAYRLDAISQDPKTSRFPGPNPLPLALVKQINEESLSYIIENSSRKNVLIF